MNVAQRLVLYLLASLSSSLLVIAVPLGGSLLSGKLVHANGAVDTGLGYIAVALPVVASTIAAAIALYAVATAGLAAIVEKPEMRGMVLIMAGLAEGIAIYGVLVSFLILMRLG